ncbi:MAG: ComEC/Rec2 family competence protein [Clostridia bacterium]|nr:ComEC/Rec2 family competence protein [Clostridia bacterium]
MTKDSVVVNNRPILYIVMAVLLAVLISSVAIITNTLFVLSIIFLILIVSLVILISLFNQKKIKSFVILCVSILVFTAVSSNFIYNYSKFNNNDLSGYSDFTGNVYSIGDIYVDEDGNNLRKLVVEGYVDKGKIKATVFVDGNVLAFVGSHVTFSGNFYRSSINYDGKFSVYPLSDKVFYSVSQVELFKINPTQIDGVFNNLKFNIYNGFRATMPKNYAIAYAMVVGDDSYVYSSLTENFRSMGIAHVFAVSGLHIGFIFILLSCIFKIFKVKKLLKLFITFCVLLLYVWFCGFSPSCIRAFIIISTLLIANTLYEKQDRLTALSLAFIVTLIINPFDFYTAGFQLSFIVYFALVFVTKPISKLLSNFCPKKVADFIAPYLSAYLASLPLSLDIFGYVSVLSMLFNILFVPILGFVYILVFILAIAILITPYYGIFAVLPKIILDCVVYVIGLIDANAFLLQNIKFGFAKYPYYLIGVINAKLINLTKKSRIIITLILLFVVILSIIAVNLVV